VNKKLENTNQGRIDRDAEIKGVEEKEKSRKNPALLHDE
jgi:hypothetical protein